MQGRPAQAPAGTARSAVCVVRWASQLDVPQGVGQVVFDGRALAFPEGGSYHADVAGPCGERRIEALLVRSAGQPGEWRFELAGPGFVPGSVRPLAGPVTQVSGSGVVARLGGAAGERVVFVFRTQP